MKCKTAWAVIAGMLFVVTAGADTVYLKNGGRFEGQIVKETAAEMVIEFEGGTMTLSPDEVEKIEKGSPRKSTAKKKFSFEKLFEGKWWRDVKSFFVHMRYKIEGLWGDLCDIVADWSKPVQRSAGAKSKQKMAENAMNELGESLSK